MSQDHRLSLNRQLEVLSLSKGSYYYKAKGESEYNETVMKWIDRTHTENPARGVAGTVPDLVALNIIVGPKRVRRLMRKTRITAVRPGRSLSHGTNSKYIKPYLLRNLKIDHPGQVWSIDITYIPMEKGFMYLTAIIDVYSRAIMAWGLHNTLDGANSIEVLDEAVRLHGAPDIINSDQGCQYTSKDWTETCEGYGITMSMDGRGRAKDNIWIERFWRTIKMEYIYLNPCGRRPGTAGGNIPVHRVLQPSKTSSGPRRKSAVAGISCHRLNGDLQIYKKMSNFASPQRR